MLTRILAAQTYPASRRDNAYTTRERYARDVTLALKRPEPWAVEVAAESMAALLPRRSHVTLVPVPSSKGHTFANLVLAYEVAKHLDNVLVLDCLVREPQESSYARRKAGRPGLPSVAQVIRWACDRPESSVYFVDNVVTTGSTAFAAQRALGRDAGVVAWAKNADVAMRAVRERAAQRATSRR